MLFGIEETTILLRDSTLPEGIVILGVKCISLKLTDRIVKIALLCRLYPIKYRYALHFVICSAQVASPSRSLQHMVQNVASWMIIKFLSVNIEVITFVCNNNSGARTLDEIAHIYFFYFFIVLATNFTNSQE